VVGALVTGAKDFDLSTTCCRYRATVKLFAGKGQCGLAKEEHHSSKC
jgi:hypothetical protein